MTADRLCAQVSGVGLIAPGIVGWEEGAAILAGRRPWAAAPLVVPAAEFLPAAERRRAGKAIRLALACGHQAVANSGRSASDLASVFASTDVDAENTHQICVALSEPEPSLSPTRFHNSVQNAVSGYWTILTGSQAPTTMIMGGDEIVAQGLLEAMSQAVESARAVLLVVFDVAMPDPLFATHPIEGGGALALVIDPAGAGPTMRLRLDRQTAAASTAGNPDEGFPAGLDELRRVHPVGPALPMLARLARARNCPGRVFDDGRGTAAGMLAFDSYHCLHVSIE
jgi:hypothetical protein